MGSVIDECECPKCKYNHCYSEFHYKVGVEEIFCPRCGFRISWDNLYSLKPLKKQTDGGFGSFSIFYKGIGECGSFADAKSHNNFVKDFNKSGFVTKKGEKPTCVCYSFKKNRRWWFCNLTTKKTIVYSRDLQIGYDGEIMEGE